MSCEGPTGSQGPGATPSVFVQLGMNTAPVNVPPLLTTQVPLNYVLGGNALGRLAFNEQTNTFTVPISGVYRLFLDATFLILTSTLQDTVGTRITVSDIAYTNFSQDLLATGDSYRVLLPNLYVGFLNKGERVTFDANSSGLPLGTVALDGPVVLGGSPIPTTAYIESYF